MKNNIKDTLSKRTRLPLAALRFSTFDFAIGRLAKGFFAAGLFTITTFSCTASIWQSDGYGYVFDLSESKLPKVYDVGSNYCLLNHFLTDEAQSEGLSIDKQTHTLEFGKLFPLKVSRVNAVPAHCSESGVVTFQNEQYKFSAPQVLETLLNHFSEHYAYSDDKKLNWQTIKQTWLQRVDNETTPAQLRQVIDDFLAMLSDGHAILFNESLDRLVHHSPRKLTSESRLLEFMAEQPDFTDISQVYRYVYQNWLSIINSYIDAEEPHQALNSNFFYAKLKGGSIYLRIESFDEHDTEAVMRHLLPKLNTASGVVIDLRDSSGGSDVVALKMMSFLTNQKFDVGVKRYKTDHGMAKGAEISVSPISKDAYAGNIVVMTSQHTPSAAEVFLMALKARGNVTIIGENSFGAFSDALTKALPNGWGITLSNEKYVDVNGRHYEFSGIPVDANFEFPNITDIKLNRDSALEYAISLLSGQSI